MAKESTHRADELKELGWSSEDVARYTELWDYRQRWGAMNLEREDRQFLRKAEAALPAIITGKAAAKKATEDKSYYRRLRFYLQAMNEAELALALEENARGAWPILLEEELRALDYYEPVLGLPDTLKAKKFDAVRESIANRASKLADEQGLVVSFDFQAPLNTLKAQEPTKWRQLREEDTAADQSYPILNASVVEGFRQEVRAELVPLIRETLPSLAKTDKADLPDDWNRA
ncbi:hypothetical protein [Prochlorococcus marinus]|uniref:hypothetical protein n=1 Tax=Prochlorococcus TaxID=1218 RepID=UPI0007B38ACA|nr:hypothetical protein [Prochlorococcus marinus]KZR75636.1 hypothetical protein PMIT1323_01930 [Prochlorococcus marinus str. MIT 1323]